MLQPDPTKRPDAAAALEQWREIRRRIFVVHLGRRLRLRSESSREMLVNDLVAFLKLGMIFARKPMTWLILATLVMFVLDRNK